ncbi:sterol desaturase family protein [Fodinibius sediminis]|uniref:Fatty acid hydroxylase superfamily protein n=1 Tax=Fodinibius sediminis TaxID=1214077 RepID=A0A521AKA1_9BACT|nr:sterol desaturase family protein [Fodinibius sediminis]SMO35225.1 Fatty acid hydroxylase superfamily protein [Fodinibius sediminis]
MKRQKIKNKGSGRIFDNHFLELLTKSPAPVSAAIYLAIMGLLLYLGVVREVVSSFWAGLSIYLSAIFSWTLFEYLFHRYINHLDEYFPDSGWARKVAHSIHGIHHEYPRDRERLMMPPVPGLLIVLLLFAGFWTVLGELVFIFMPGFMTGYLAYASIHIAVHKRKVPSLLKTQHRHHALHHYKHHDKAFGVSTTLWDRVFGTMPPENSS